MKTGIQLDKALAKQKKNGLSTRKSLVTMNQPLSMVSESYKMVHTNLHYMGVDKSLQTILVTSSMPEEGKTTTAANMAITYAQSGIKTLLLECDLRRSRIHTVCDLPQEPGLTNVLTDKLALEEVVHQLKGIEHLDVLTAGHTPPSPVELLESVAFAQFLEVLKERYEMIIIDAPPVLHVSDALLLQHLVDGTILVVAFKTTRKDTVLRSVKHLEKVQAKVLGTILTKVDVHRKGYYYHYHGSV